MSDNDELLKLFDRYVVERKLDVQTEQRIQQLKDELNRLTEKMADGGLAAEAGQKLRMTMLQRNMRMLMCGPDAVILTKGGIDVIEGIYTVHRKESVESDE